MVPLAVLAGTLLAGCFGVVRAHVPDAVLSDGWRETDRGGGQRWLGLAAEWEHVVYETNVTGFGGPYPASLTLLSLEVLGRLSRGELRDALEEQVRDSAERQGIALEQDSEQRGERRTASRLGTQWFTYRGVASPSADLFNPGQSVRILGEVWNDGRSEISVLAVGMAQTTGPGPTGRFFPDLQSWGKIVADPDGTIDGARGTEGLVWNVVSH